MLRIRKVLEDSKGDYESTAAQEIYFDRSHKKRIPEFVTVSQAVIDNKPSQPIRECLSFLSGWWCMTTFGIFQTRWERTNFSHWPWRTNGKYTLRNFSTKSNILSKWTFFSFSPTRTISPRWTCRTTIDLLYPHSMYCINESQIPNPHHGV